MSERLKKFLNCQHKNVQQFTEICLDCGENIYTTPQEIMKKEAKTEQSKNEKWNENGW